MPQATEGFTMQEYLQSIRNLWAAVMERAVMDLTDRQYKKKEANDLYRLNRDSALRWVRSKSRDEYSFEWVCMVLDCNPRLMRRLILEKADAINA